MTNTGQIKIVGPEIPANTTTFANGSMIPTNAGAGANNDPGAGGTFSGFGNSVQGGASLCRVLNTTTGLVSITVSNNGTNTGSITLQPNTDYFITKYPYDKFFCNNTSGGVLFSPVAKSW